MSIGISNYEGLCNRKFDLAEHIRARGQEGYKLIRCFTDLGWGGASGVVSADNNMYLYEFDAINKRFNPNKINKLFVDKLYECGRAAKQSGMEGIVLCLATNPKYYQKTVNVKGYGNYPWQLGFRDTMGFMQVADPENNSGQEDPATIKAWKAFDQYIQDLVKVCLDAPNPMMFRTIETYNELRRWGSIGDTHPHIAKIAKAVRPNILFQFNPPLEELEDCVLVRREGQACFRWPLKLMNQGYKGFRAQELSFHGFYTGSEVKKAAALLKNGGIDLNRVTLETDGATPNGEFTREDHHQHYLWRTKWDDNATNVSKTIAAHCDLIAAAKQVGVSLNIQSPIKWSLMKETPALAKFYKECAEELKK